MSVQGLRVHDTKDICPWEILEGVKNSGPLMLSWFGAVRMKRKPLRFEEQRHLVRFHSHQNQFQNFICGPHTVHLPEEQMSLPMDGTTAAAGTAEGGKSTDPLPSEAAKQAAPMGGHPHHHTPGVTTADGMELGGAGGGSAMPNPVPSNVGGGAGGAAGGSGMAPPGSAPIRPQNPYQGGMGNMPPGTVGARMRLGPSQGMMNPIHGHSAAAGSSVMRGPMNSEMRKRLEEIRQQQIQQSRSQSHMTMPPPVYPGGPGMAASATAGAGGASMPPTGLMGGLHRPAGGIPGMGYGGQMNMRNRIQAMQMHQQRKLMQLRMQHMHQQQHGGMMGQQGYAPGHPAAAYQGHAPPMQGMRPMQANPPMQMQQVLQQRTYPPGHPGGPPPGGMHAPPPPGHTAMLPPTGIPPGRQPGMQYPHQMPGGMSQVMPRQNMY